MANTSTPQMIAAILFVFFLLLKSNNMNFYLPKGLFLCIIYDYHLLFFSSFMLCCLAKCLPV